MKVRQILIFLACLLTGIVFIAGANTNISAQAPAQSEQGSANISQKPFRLVSLSPHLTELVYALNRQDVLIGVSDYSDYPQPAQSLPRLASYQGAKLNEILRLGTTHVLAWEGGNKAADLQKLEASGIKVYRSKINDIASLKADIQAIADFILAKPESLEQLMLNLQDDLDYLAKTYRPQIHSNGAGEQYNTAKSIETVYVMNQKPLVVLGKDTWLNELLDLCRLDNIFADSVAPYPQVSEEQVLRRKPKLLIEGKGKTSAHLLDVSGSFISKQATQIGPASELGTLVVDKIIRASADKLHRFTPRAIDEMREICAIAHYQTKMAR